MYLKKPKKIIIICMLIIISIGIASILLISLNRTEAPTPPEIDFFDIDDDRITICPSKSGISSNQNASNNELLYCLNDEPNPNSCTWQTSAEFYIQYDHTYYGFIKSIATDLISEPRMLNYSTPGYINGHEMQI